MSKILVLGGVSYNTMAYFNEYSGDIAGTLSADYFYETVGSTGAGKAMAFKRLGADVTLYGIIGKDGFGEKIIARFNEKQIPFYYDIDTKGTERHLNLMKLKTDERISVFLQSPDFDIEINSELVENLISQADVIFLNIADYCRKFIPFIKKHQKKVWCDLHSYNGSEYYDDFIEIADVLLFSSEKLADYADYLKKIQQQGKSSVFCSHGKNGATAIDSKGNFYEMDSISPKSLKDTNGAGDNFFAGIYFGLSNGLSIQKSLMIGTIMGLLATESFELVNDSLSLQLLNEKMIEHYKVVLDLKSLDSNFEKQK